MANGAEIPRKVNAADVSQLRRELAEAVDMLNHQLKRNGELFRENEALRQQLQALQVGAAA